MEISSVALLSPACNVIKLETFFFYYMVHNSQVIKFHMHVLLKHFFENLKQLYCLHLQIRSYQRVDFKLSFFKSEIWGLGGFLCLLTGAPGILVLQTNEQGQRVGVRVKRIDKTINKLGLSCAKLIFSMQLYVTQLEEIWKKTYIFF